ncbi:MAG: hypothetical protein ACF8Q5_01165 [Phycisphaerales bacterium JB040]
MIAGIPRESVGAERARGVARGVLGVLVGTLVALGLSGCGSADRMGRYTVVVSMAESMKDPASGLYPSVEVDLVGVNPTKKAEFASMELDSYFAPQSARRSELQRNGERKLLTFTNQNPGPKTLELTDLVWNTWLGENTRSNNAGIGATHLFVLAKMPRPRDSAAVDPRRLELPLSTTKWNNGQRIEISITPIGLRLNTAMKVEKE